MNKRLIAFLNFREYLKLKGVDFLWLALLREPRFYRVLVYMYQRSIMIAVL